MFDETIDFIKSIYPNQNPVNLHSPVFIGKEKEYLLDCIDSTYVSYKGQFVSKFEEITARFTNSKYAVAMVNGTTALQIALQVAGVGIDCEVITQSLTFVATANAISHCGAEPVFVDVDLNTLGMSPGKLKEWLENNVIMHKADGLNYCFNKSTRKRVSAIVPMHTFGFPCRIDEIVEIAKEYDIPVIEDSAESLGSFYKGKHTGTFGLAGILSYNGNKTITTGGGGMIITDDEVFAKKVKHLSTTAKVSHKWEFIHDEIGFNFRLTNLNAAIGVAQMEKLEIILKNKRETANLYNNFFKNTDINYFSEPENANSNYWLNCVQLNNRIERDDFLEITNSKGIMTRPIWRLMNKLSMYKGFQSGYLENSLWLEDRIVNLPSGFRS